MPVSLLGVDPCTFYFRNVKAKHVAVELPVFGRYDLIQPRLVNLGGGNDCRALGESDLIEVGGRIL